MVTIKDIAKESGYSVSTVSRVLNHRNDVSPDAKKKIEEIVEKYHFVPNNNAKHLKQTNSESIGVLVKGISNMLFASIVEEIQRTVEKTRYTVIVSYLDEDDNEVEQALLLCRERKPLGLLFLGGNPEYFEQDFSRVDVPCVMVSTQSERMHFDNLSSVSTDDVEAAHCAVDALFEANHRQIGILGGNIETSFTSHQRFVGCAESFQSHGVAFDAGRCYESVRFSFDSAYRGMKRLLAKFPEVTAIFAMSDVMAIGAIRALIDMGYKVPEDISVIGFDGTMLAEYSHPRLTTIKQQYKVLATRSIEILFGQIELNRKPVHELIPFELIQGESVKAVGE